MPSVQQPFTSIKTSSNHSSKLLFPIRHFSIRHFLHSARWNPCNFFSPAGRSYRKLKTSVHLVARHSRNIRELIIENQVCHRMWIYCGKSWTSSRTFSWLWVNGRCSWPAVGAKNGEIKYVIVTCYVLRVFLAADVYESHKSECEITEEKKGKSRFCAEIVRVNLKRLSVMWIQKKLLTSIFV